MEQLIYTSVVTSEQVGFQTVARSRGLQSSFVAELESMFGFYGQPPDRIPDAGSLSFAMVQPEQFAAWRLFIQGLDASGSRRNIWVHCITFDRRELLAMNGDPFVLDDAGLFLKPHDRVDGVMPQMEVPPTGEMPQPLDALLKMPALRRDMLIAAGLCTGYAYVCGDVSEGNIRALRYLVPPNQRGLLTFYGMATGIPRTKAKLIVLGIAHLGRDLDAKADIIADLQREEYHGLDPTPYAATVSRLLEARDTRALTDLIELAGELGASVCGSATSELVKAFESRQAYIAQCDVAGVRSLSTALAARGNATGVAKYYITALCAMGRGAIGTASAQKLSEIVEALVEAKPTMTVACVAEALTVIEGVWDSLATVPSCLLSLLKAAAAWPVELAPRMTELARRFGAYRAAFGKLAWSVEDMGGFWKVAAATIAANSDAPRELCEWVYASCLESSLAASDPDTMGVQWVRYGKTIKAAGPVTLVGSGLLRVSVRREFLEIVDHVLFRTDYRPQDKVLGDWLAWSAGDDAIFRHFAARVGQLLSHKDGVLRLAMDAYHDRRLTAQRGVELLRRSCPDVSKCWNMSLRFLGEVSIGERLGLFEEASRNHDLREMEMIAEAVIPVNEEEAAVVVDLSAAGSARLSKMGAKVLRGVLRETSQRFPRSGAGMMLLEEERKRMRVKAVLLAVPCLALVAGVFWLLFWLTGVFLFPGNQTRQVVPVQQIRDLPPVATAPSRPGVRGKESDGRPSVEPSPRPESGHSADKKRAPKADLTIPSSRQSVEPSPRPESGHDADKKRAPKADLTIPSSRQSVEPSPRPESGHGADKKRAPNVAGRVKTGQ